MQIQMKVINSLGEFLSDEQNLDEDEVHQLKSLIKSSEDFNYLSMIINGNLTVFRGDLVNNSIIQIIEYDE